MMANSKLSLLILLCISLCLPGCTSAVWNRGMPPSPTATGLVAGAASGLVIGSMAGATPMGVAIGTIWGGALGSVLQSKQTLVEYLMYNGVQVIRVGDDVRLILPADRFFFQNSANLNPNYYPVLNKVAVLLGAFNKISIKIAAYTDNSGAWQRNLALTRLQAQTMQTYLWTYGVNAQMMYSIGYGEQYPIATNTTPQGQAMNRRIEITLRKLEYEPLI